MNPYEFFYVSRAVPPDILVSGARNSRGRWFATAARVPINNKDWGGGSQYDVWGYQREPGVMGCHRGARLPRIAIGRSRLLQLQLQLLLLPLRFRNRLAHFRQRRVVGRQYLG